MLLIAAGALAALIYFLSAPPPAAPALAEETVVVLPGPDGRAGTVVVQRGAGTQVLDQPYAASRARGDGPAELARLSEQEVRQSFGAALGALPARPVSFVLYFEVGKDELTEVSRSELQKVLAELKQRAVPDIVVIGHTDTVGDAAANDRLSAQRAQRVKTLLVEIGIPAERIETTGRGERELLVPTADNVAEPRNRRVEVNLR